MPSGRAKGPENSRSTFLDERAGESAGPRDGDTRCSGNSGIDLAAGKPGGCEASPSLDHLSLGRDPDIVCTRSGNAAIDVSSDPGAGFHASLRKCVTRFHGERTTAERQDTHDARLVARQQLV
eukprot:2247128-Pleurochrysis_carterae.AAC.2